MIKQKVAVIGLGNLGSAMANLLANNGSDVIAWDHAMDVVNEVNEQHSISNICQM